MTEFSLLLLQFTVSAKTSENWKRAVIEWLYIKSLKERQPAAGESKMSLDEMIATKLANKEYASGSTDNAKNERDVIIDILTSSAISGVTLSELNGLMLHSSHSVREVAKKASAGRRGINLDQEGKAILDPPATDAEREIMAITPCER
jgi:hypothetical protein